MVKAALGGAAVALLVVALGLTATISVIQEWVVVTVPPYEACDETPLGQLGLYQATFNPECTQGDDVNAATKATYGRFEKVEGPTTEFWPLFPTQTSFNDFFGENVPEFESCEAAFDEAGATMTAVKAGANVVQAGLYQQLEAGVAESYTALKAQLTGTFALVDGLVAQMWAGNIQLGVPTAVGAVQQLAFTPAQAGSAGVFGVLTLALQNVAPANPDPARTFTFTKVKATDLAASDAVTFGNLGGLLASADPTSFAAMMASIVPSAIETASGGQITEAQAISVRGAWLIASSTGLCESALTSGSGPTDYDHCLFGGVGQVTDVINFDWTELEIWVNALIGAQPALQPVKDLFDACDAAAFAVDGFANSGLNCSTMVTGLPDVLAAPTSLCGALNATGTGPLDGSTSSGFTECSPFVMLGNLIPVLAAGDAISGDPELATAIPVLAEELESCGLRAGATSGADAGNKSSCVDFMVDGNGADDNQVAGVPASMDMTSTPYSVCLGVNLKTGAVSGDANFCTTFQQFVNIAGAADPAVGFFIPVVNGCIGLGATDYTVCKGVVTTNPNQDQANGFIGLFLDGETTADFIKECNDDEEDARRIELAQVLVPAAMGVEFIAIVLALAAIKMNKAPLAYVAAVLAAGGTALVLSGLLLVKTAPVYAKVGGDKVDDEPFYAAGLAETLAYGCIAAPVLAALLLVAAGCMKGDEESQLASKVDSY